MCNELVVLTLEELLQRKGVRWRTRVELVVDVDTPSPQEVIEKLGEMLEGAKYDGSATVAGVSLPSHKGCFSPFDSDGKAFESTYNSKKKERVYYKPACNYGFTDCISDPARMLAHDEDWWERCGSCVNCDDYCIDGSRYDDEDK